jgi:hypothetical protein
MSTSIWCRSLHKLPNTVACLAEQEGSTMLKLRPVIWHDNKPVPYNLTPYDQS